MPNGTVGVWYRFGALNLQTSKWQNWLIENYRFGTLDLQTSKCRIWLAILKEHKRRAKQCACACVMFDHVLSLRSFESWGLLLARGDAIHAGMRYAWSCPFALKLRVVESAIRARWHNWRVNSLCLTMLIRLNIAGHGVCRSGLVAQPFTCKLCHKSRWQIPWSAISRRKSIVNHNEFARQLRHRARVADPTKRDHKAKEHCET